MRSATKANNLFISRCAAQSGATYNFLTKSAARNCANRESCAIALS